MHELSLAEGVLQLVQDAAERERFARVACLRLEVGQLAGVEVEALRFALEAIAPGTCLAGARVEIDEPPGQGWCARCAQTVAIASRADPCPRCGSVPVQATGGNELRVCDLVVCDA
jgi:hydrogenase nickel incorporation protein HypA/HybF